MSRYLNEVYQVRINEETKDKIAEIIKAFPDRFDSESQVIRGAINYYYRREVNKDERAIREMDDGVSESRVRGRSKKN